MFGSNIMGFRFGADAQDYDLTLIFHPTATIVTAVVTCAPFLDRPAERHPVLAEQGGPGTGIRSSWAGP
jgi:hypothetical protein